MTSLVSKLSFTAMRNGKGLPTYTKGQKPRCFWNVEATGDYGVDCVRGSRLALEFLAYEALEQQSTWPISILPSIVNDMPRPLTGVEVGFLSMISDAFHGGEERARQQFEYQQAEMAKLRAEEAAEATRRASA